MAKRIETPAQRIKKALDYIDIKQAELSRRTGIDKGTISLYISGKYEPSSKKAILIAEALHTSPEWILGFDVPMKKEKYLIPVLGTVRAGIPIDAIEEILDYEEIGEEMASQGEFFGLKIKGDSMEPKFSEGDVVIVRKQPDVESGDIAIVLVNGDEATIKKVQKFNGGLNLIPSNSAYDVITYNNQQIEQLPVSIIGKVVELRAKF